MTYSISPATYRLGYSISWNVINSPLFFSRSVRLNIVLNTFLKGMLKYFRIKLVKWVSHSEGNYYKLVLVVLDASYPEYYKIRFKSNRLRFFAWNYIYYNKVTWKVIQLKDFYTAHRYPFKARLGSGRFWHKFYKSLFFSLGKKFLHARKAVKNGTIDLEFDNSDRGDRSGILKLNLADYFNKIKYSWAPQYQFMFRFYFKLYLYLHKCSLAGKWGGSNSRTKVPFFIQLFLLSVFLQGSIRKLNKEPLQQFYSRFVNVNQAYYRASKRIVPDNNFYFDAFNYVKGTNYRWVGSGRISQRAKLLNAPWSDFFLKGFLFNKSYKKIARRWILNAFGEVKTTERARLANFMVKNFVVWKKPVIRGLWVKKSNFFFSKMFLIKAARRLRRLTVKRRRRRNFSVKLSRSIEFLKFVKRAQRNNKKKHLRRYFDKAISTFVLSNQYFYNTREDAYMNKVGFLKIRKVLKRIRASFLKNVKTNFINRNWLKVSNRRSLPRLSRSVKVLWKLKKFSFLVGSLRNQFLTQNFENKLLLADESISFFRNQQKIAAHNPFSALSDNFLLLLYRLKFSFLLKMRKEKKKVLKDYWSVKNDKLSPTAEKSAKLYYYLKCYNTLLSGNLILKKYYYLLRVSRSILLFRSYWSLEFYKLYFTLKLRKYNFRTIFKSTSNNILASRKYRGMNSRYRNVKGKVNVSYFRPSKIVVGGKLYYYNLRRFYYIWFTHVRLVSSRRAFNFYLRRGKLLKTTEGNTKYSKTLFIRFLHKGRSTWKFFLFQFFLTDFIKTFRMFFHKVPKKRKKKAYMNSYRWSKALKKRIWRIKLFTKSPKQLKSNRFYLFLLWTLFNYSSRALAKKSFKLYKFKLYLARPRFKAFAFPKKIVVLKRRYSHFSFDKNYFVPRGIAKAFKRNRLSHKRLELLRDAKQTSIKLRSSVPVFKAFKKVKAALQIVFIKNAHLKHHKKYRHIWRNVRNYTRSVTYFRNALFWENWFMRKYVFYIVPFFFNVLLKIRLNSLRFSLKNPVWYESAISVNKVYLYRVFASLSKKLLVTKSDKIVLILKKKIIVGLLATMSRQRNVLRSGQRKFINNQRNSSLFDSPRTISLKKFFKKKKLLLNIVDRSAKLRPSAIAKKKNVKFKKNRIRAHLFKKKIRRKIGFLMNPKKKYIRRVSVRKPVYPKLKRVSPFFKLLNMNVIDFLGGKSGWLHWLRLGQVPRVNKSLLNSVFVASERVFFKRWLRRNLINQVSRHRDFRYVYDKKKSLMKFEVHALRSLSLHWKSRKYDHFNRHRLYFSKKFLNSLGSYCRGVVKHNYEFLRAYPRRFVLSFDFSYFFNTFLSSTKRYTKNLRKALAEINKYLVTGATTYLAAKRPKKKRNFPLRSRNRWIGRKNYFKYSAKNRQEMRFELGRKRESRMLKHWKRVYKYYRLQRNFNKQLIKAQPKLFPKGIFNAGLWLRRQHLISKHHLLKSKIPVVRNRLKMYEVVDWTSYRKKFEKDLTVVDFRELQYHYTILEFFKKNSFWSPIWRSYKRLYWTKFYLYRVFAKRVYSEHRNSYRVAMPFKNRFFTRSRQYKHAFLNKLEFAYMSTTRFFSKYRLNWVKDFFLRKEHLKILYTYNKKAYYNFCLAQDNNVVRFKDLLLKRIIRVKKQKNRDKFISNVSLWKLKNEIGLFKQLLKNYVVLKHYNFKFDYFLRFFLMNMLRFPQIMRKRKKAINFMYLVPVKSKLSNNTIELLPVSFFIWWFKSFITNAKCVLDTDAVKFVLKSRELEKMDYNISGSEAIIWEKPWNVLYFGRFARFFYNEARKYLKAFRWSKLKLYEGLAEQIDFILYYLYSFFINLRNLKKIFFIKRAVAALKRTKLKNFLVVPVYRSQPVTVCMMASWSRPLYYYFYYLNFMKKITKNFFRLRNIYFFNKNSYSSVFWLKNKKFLFWLEQSLEKVLHMNVKLNYISSVKAISKFCRGSTNFFLYTKRLHLYRLAGGWKQQTIYADILWVILISIKYYSSSFLSNMIAEQIVKRKKQWPFIKILKATIREILPKNLMDDSNRVDGLRISINGKINGRDRSINYLICKLYKDLQSTKMHPIFIKIDYSLSFANSKYGVFGIKVWLSRV